MKPKYNIVVILLALLLYSLIFFINAINAQTPAHGFSTGSDIQKTINLLKN